MEFFWGGRDCEENYYYNYFFWGGRDCEENYYYNFFLGGVGIMRRSKMPVTRREVKRSSEVGDLRLSCKSYSWNFFFWGGGRDCEEN